MIGEGTPMNTWLLLAAVAMGGTMEFERHEIDDFPAGYQVAVADLSGDGRLDVVALSTQSNRVDWYENPGWRRRPVARTERNIDLAVCDLDGDGRVEIAVAAGFYYDQGDRGGEIYLLRRTEDMERPWTKHLVATDPVVHRLRFGDLDGDGRKELVHASIFGPGSRGPRGSATAHLWAFRIPKGFEGGEVPTWKIDESLHVLHGLWLGDLDGGGREEILTASYEGIHRFDFEGTPAELRWRRTHLAAGAPPVSDAPAAPRGTSEVMPGRLADGSRFLAAIEPWHGHQVVVYTQKGDAGPWQRRVIDEGLAVGHALVVADFDADGDDEIVAGWRGGQGGLNAYDPIDAAAGRFRSVPLDRGIAVEGALAADLSGDGRTDLVAVGGRTNDLVWYENRGR